jgi:hypothetical protein
MLPMYMVTMITKNRQMATKKIKTKKKKITCIFCDYITSNSYDFNKHILTAKHLKKINDNKKSQVLINVCTFCKKEYKHRSGVSRHQRKCKNNPKNFVENRKIAPMLPVLEDNKKIAKNEIVDAKDLKIKELEIELLKKDKQHFIDKLKNKDDIIDILKTKGNGNTNNFNNCNNKITLNVYLNEHCKDAMNLTDFVNQIQISLEDLEYSKNNGFAKGITNILSKQLKDLNPTERPIHCSDTKRLQFYVKDEGKWGREGANEKIDKTIQNVQKRQLNKLQDWEEAHPNWKNSDALLKEWQYMCMGIMNSERGGSKDIKKNLCEELNLKNEIKKLN